MNSPMNSTAKAAAAIAEQRLRPDVAITTSSAGPVDYGALPLTLDQWRARELPGKNFLLGQAFATTTRAMFSADTGLGKTHLLMALGMAMAAGEPFCHWAGSGDPARVLMVDGEMSRELVKERLADAERRMGIVPPGFWMLCKEDVPDMEPLDTPKGQAWLDGLIDLQQSQFLILDNCMSLTVGDLSLEESWRPVTPWMRRLTARNVGTLWANHTGHDATRSYGTKTREWQLDVAMIGEKVDDPAADIAMKITFSKARQRKPDNRADFEPVVLRLKDDQWETTTGGITRKGRPPKNTDVALRTLREAIEGDGLAVPQVGPVPSGASGVRLETWRTYYHRRVPLDTGGKTDDLAKRRAHEARKKEFQRARGALHEARQIGIVGDWVWIEA